MKRELAVIIVDDEAPALRRLERLIDDIENVRVAAATTRPDEVVELCRRSRPDVVILDVEMPGLDGVRLARGLRDLEPAPAVIFVTAFERYAVDAFDLAAVDYLVKPVRPERLARALERASRRPAGRQACLQSRLGERMISIAVDEIRALIAEDKYTIVHHTGGESLVEDSLVGIEERFPGLFLRVHRKALVSRRYLRGLRRDEDGCDRVEVEGIDYCPPVSRRNLARVRQELRN